MVPIRGGYESAFLQVLDNISWLLTVPWSQCGSLCLSSIYFTTHDTNNYFKLFIRLAVLFPLLAVLTVVWTPVAVVGYILRVLLGELVPRQPFIYHCTDSRFDADQPCPSKMTFLTANVILCPEIFVRFNNNRNSYWRMNEIPRRLMTQNPSLNNKQNLHQQNVTKEDIVIDQIPDVDIIMLQESCERIQGVSLSKALQSKYPYSLYDVNRHRFSDNCCLMGSGLFLGSRYPILEADFFPFSYRTNFGKFVSYGVLVVKVHLGIYNEEGERKKGVGYVANLHTQAYEGRDTVILKQLQQAEAFIDDFIKNTFNSTEELLMFTVLGGDFNSDNYSPCDKPVQNHSIWESYQDVCMKQPGEDHHWSIGTELRQRLIHLPESRDSKMFRKILCDDILRRKYILDADVQEQNMDLMIVNPKPDQNGAITAQPFGGQRRIDKILVKRDNSFLKNEILNNNDYFSPSSAWYTSSLAGLSDHVPFILELKQNIQYK